MPVTPKILAFDTATQACSAAVLNGGKIFERFDVAPQKHSDLILLMIDAVLKEAGTTLQELDAIAVGVGPGSFMGVRLAVSIAQSLAFAQGKKIIPVSTLQILAQSAYRELNSLTKKIKNLLVGWDARMHEIYFGIYQLENNLMKPVQKDQMISPENFKLSKEIDSIAGNAWQVYENEFSTEVKKFLKEKNSLQAVIYASQINLQEIAPIDPSILACRRGGKERATGVYTQYMTVANDE
ncbi:MAG: tRNA (adenosine(37)-N6)-threonylcarbamoyltransferase complex dimerization subunit type 1 TsaB, partial [Gammaproteobacteria bacterium RIFOXYB2_FULL_38_6]